MFGFATKEAYDKVLEKLEDSQDGFFGAFADDAAISADPDSCDVYLQAGQECGLNVNFAHNKTEVLLGKCANRAEKERRISNYHETNGIPRENIKIHPDNGGEDYSIQ